jgi:ribosome recycling factor
MPNDNDSSSTNTREDATNPPSKAPVPPREPQTSAVGSRPHPGSKGSGGPSSQEKAGATATGQQQSSRDQIESPDGCDDAAESKRASLALAESPELLALERLFGRIEEVSQEKVLLESRLEALEGRVGQLQAGSATSLQVTDGLAAAETRLQEYVVGTKASFMRAVQTLAAELREHASEAEARVLAAATRRTEERLEESLGDHRQHARDDAAKVQASEKARKEFADELKQAQQQLQENQLALTTLQTSSAELQRRVAEVEASKKGTAAGPGQSTKVEKEITATAARLLALEERCDRTFLTRNYAQEVANKLVATEYCRRDEIEPLKKEFEEERVRIDQVLREQGSRLSKLQRTQEEQAEAQTRIPQLPAQIQIQGLTQTKADIDTFFKSLQQELLPMEAAGGSPKVAAPSSAQRYLQQLDQAFTVSPPGSRGTEPAEERHRGLREMVRGIGVKLPKLPP